MPVLFKAVEEYRIGQAAADIFCASIAGTSVALIAAFIEEFAATACGVDRDTSRRGGNDKVGPPLSVSAPTGSIA